jgi:hypothetical protein
MTVSTCRAAASLSSNTRPISARPSLARRSAKREGGSTVNTVGVKRPSLIRSGSPPSPNVLVTDIQPPIASTVEESRQAR